MPLRCDICGKIVSEELDEKDMGRVWIECDNCSKSLLQTRVETKKVERPRKFSARVIFGRAGELHYIEKEYENAVQRVVDALRKHHHKLPIVIIVSDDTA